MIRSMFFPRALRGIEASFLADTSLRKLRTAVFKVVSSRRQPLANVGTLLCLVDVVWFRFRMLRGYTLLTSLVR